MEVVEQAVGRSLGEPRAKELAQERMDRVRVSLVSANEDPGGDEIATESRRQAEPELEVRAQLVDD